MDWGTIGAVAGVLVIVASAQLLLVTTLLKGAEDRLAAKIQSTEDRLTGRIDVLASRFDGLDRRMVLLEDRHSSGSPT